MLHHKGRTSEAYAELVSIWSTATWEPDEMQSKRQTLVLLTNLSNGDSNLAQGGSNLAHGDSNLSHGKEHFIWLNRFNEMQVALGFDSQTSCAICLEPLVPHPVTQASPRVQISTCFHAVHVHCWDGHRAAVRAGESVRCPVCRHEIIVTTSPAVYNPETRETTPLRPGREREDIVRSVSGTSSHPNTACTEGRRTRNNRPTALPHLVYEQYHNQ